ncbi:hypothetical protein ACK3TF_002486 [Chlorella vulgaris]
MLATCARKAGAPVMRHAGSTQTCQVSRPGIAPRLRQGTPARHQSRRPTAAAGGGNRPQLPAAAPARPEDKAWLNEQSFPLQWMRVRHLVELQWAAAFAALGLGSMCGCVWLLFQSIAAILAGSSLSLAVLAPKYETLLTLLVGRAEAAAVAPGLAAALTPTEKQLVGACFVLHMLTWHIASRGIVAAKVMADRLNRHMLEVTGAHPSSNSAPLSRHLLHFDWTWGDLLALWVCRAVVMLEYSPVLLFVSSGNLVLSAIVLGIYAALFLFIMRC